MWRMETGKICSYQHTITFDVDKQVEKQVEKQLF